MPNGKRAGEKEGMQEGQHLLAGAGGSEGWGGAFGTCGEEGRSQILVQEDRPGKQGTDYKVM